MKRAFTAMVVLAAGLGGCRSMKVDYSIEVRNNTSGPVTASVMHDYEERVVQAYATRVHPNGRGQISLPRRSKGEQLRLEVTASNNPSTPAKMPLSPGMTYVNVTREGETGPIRLEPVR